MKLILLLILTLFLVLLVSLGLGLRTAVNNRIMQYQELSFAGRWFFSTKDFFFLAISWAFLIGVFAGIGFGVMYWAEPAWIMHGAIAGSMVGITLIVASLVAK